MLLNTEIFAKFNVNNKLLGNFYDITKINGINKLPYTKRILIEMLIRNQLKNNISNDAILTIIEGSNSKITTIPFDPSRIILQDYTGIPLLVDLTLMREYAHSFGINCEKINPAIPTTLVIDHSFQAIHRLSPDSIKKNMQIEYNKNRERYEFIKWCSENFENFSVIPPGIGIIHQVNLEFLSKGVTSKDNIFFPDTLIGTDSHTTMANGIGILGWGVGGIEAETAILGYPMYIRLPEIVGIHLTGKLGFGVTATDLVLTVTNTLREKNVVGKIVEFYGQGARELPVHYRVTIANMAPDYGAITGFFAIDEKTIDYFVETGRTELQISTIKQYYQNQGIFGISIDNSINFDLHIEFDLSNVLPCAAGPSRPQDKVLIADLNKSFNECYTLNKNKRSNFKQSSDSLVSHGDILVAAITSCTNTSNPYVLIAAGLVAKKAFELSLTISSKTRTYFNPGSKIAALYLESSGLQQYLDYFGFTISGYGCAACVGNIGALENHIEQYVAKNNIIAVSVTSGNRNFDSRIHPRIKANYLMSPPLVIAYAIAGKINFDVDNEPIGLCNSKRIYLSDIWPSDEEINNIYDKYCKNPCSARQAYKECFKGDSYWSTLRAIDSKVFKWDLNSTYITRPNFLEVQSYYNENFEFKNARCIGIFGDSITTDHISPAGKILPDSIAGKFLSSKGIADDDMNTFGARRGNHEVMVRGCFSNPNLINKMVGKTGSHTIHYPTKNTMPIYEASLLYKKESVPLIIIAGKEYGTGSSRDWAAKAVKLLGVTAVVCLGIEKIHRSNLIGMGILPFIVNDNYEKLEQIKGDELFNLESSLKKQKFNKDFILKVTRLGKISLVLSVTLAIESNTEFSYLNNGGLIPYNMNMLKKGYN